MRVVLNSLTALKSRTGIGQYTSRLAAEMASLLPAGEFATYPPSLWAKLAAALLQRPAGPPGQAKSSLKLKLHDLLKRGGRTALGLHFARFCRTYGAKLYHEPNYIPFATDVPTVITVHDLSVLLHPEWHPADRVREHVRHLERATASAARIITDTEQVRREVIVELGVRPERVAAVHLGVGAEFVPQPVAKSYFLCVGTIEPRKNLLTAMTAYAALPKRVRERYPLLLAGPWGWRADAEFDYYTAQGRDAGIRHLGYVPDADLPRLYSGAIATLYPSLYEGFGLPPLEATACGSTAICSRGTLAVREVMGHAAAYCDAHDIDGWRNEMLQLIEEPRAMSVHAARFTWQRTAQQTLGIYDSVLNGSRQKRAA